jgi:hypothetical protein
MNKYPQGMAHGRIQPAALLSGEVSGPVTTGIRLAFAPRIPAAAALSTTVLSGQYSAGCPAAG